MDSVVFLSHTKDTGETERGRMKNPNKTGMTKNLFSLSLPLSSLSFYLDSVRPFGMGWRGEEGRWKEGGTHPSGTEPTEPFPSTLKEQEERKEEQGARDSRERERETRVDAQSDSTAASFFPRSFCWTLFFCRLKNMFASFHPLLPHFPHSNSFSRVNEEN